MSPRITRRITCANVRSVRMVLASANVVGLVSLRRAVTRRFGRPAGFMFVLLSITQFHLPFWMGRTLPNMFALLPGESSMFSPSSRPHRHSFGCLAGSKYCSAPHHRPCTELDASVQVECALGNRSSHVRDRHFPLGAAPSAWTSRSPIHPQVHVVVQCNQGRAHFRHNLCW